MKSIVSILIAILFLLTATAAFTAEIESISASDGGSVTLPVYHDTTMRNVSDLSAREKHFLSQVPEVVGSKTTGKTLRDACREMLLAEVIHVPALPCGNWTKNDSVRYWSIYQAWTGPAKVRVPLVRGPQGPAGQNGNQGPRGPRGFTGPQGTAGQGTVINNYSFGNTTTMACQLGGALAPTISSTSLMGVGYQQVQDVKICISNDTGVNIVNNNANTNVVPVNNTINIGPGNATGTANGTGTSTAGK